MHETRIIEFKKHKRQLFFVLEQEKITCVHQIVKRYKLDILQLFRTSLIFLSDY